MHTKVYVRPEDEGATSTEVKNKLQKMVSMLQKINPNVEVVWASSESSPEPQQETN